MRKTYIFPLFPPFQLSVIINELCRNYMGEIVTWPRRNQYLNLLNDLTGTAMPIGLSSIMKPDFVSSFLILCLKRWVGMLPTSKDTPKRIKRLFTKTLLKSAAQQRLPII